MGGKVKKHPYSGMAGAQREFIEAVHSLARHRRHSEVLDDFLEMAYCAIAKTTHFPFTPQAEKLEERYMAVVHRAKDDDYIRQVATLLPLVKLGIMAHGDFLGRCAGEIGGLNEWLGQFFTPFEVCRAMARMSMHDVEGLMKERGWISVAEPAIGGGAMVLAAAEYVEELGHDPARSMFVEAVDISSTAFKMAYVQFALRGIPAEVIHGNALSLEVWERQFTPAMGAFLCQHEESWLEWRRTSVVRPVAQAVEQAPLLVDAPPPQPSRKDRPIRQPVHQPPAPPKREQLSFF